MTTVVGGILLLNRFATALALPLQRHPRPAHLGRTAVTTQETQLDEAILLPSTPAHASATNSFERFLDMLCTATDPTIASRTGSARV